MFGSINYFEFWPHEFDAFLYLKKSSDCANKKLISKLFADICQEINVGMKKRKILIDFAIKLNENG